jgi:hypothetical protein
MFKDQKALGFLEVLIALTIVGTGMVIVTSMSLRSMRVAKMNENQDVAIQVAVDAMDYLKNPGDIGISEAPITAPAYYSLASDTFEISRENVPQRELEANENDCNESSETLVSNLWESDPTYTICRQIMIEKTSSDRYDIEVTVIWSTVGDYNKHVISGHRVGKLVVE